MGVRYRLDRSRAGRGVWGGGCCVLRAVPWSVSPALPSVQPGLSRHPVSELVGETGGAAHAQKRVVPRGQRELAPPVGQQASGGRGGHLLAGVELAGGDGGLPGVWVVTTTHSHRSRAAASAVRAWAVVSWLWVRV